MAALSDYTALITSEHATKPKYAALMSLWLQACVDLINFYAGLPAAFDLDLAIGAQLDAIGRWVGISRYVSVPITGLYFSWDTAGVGWNQGIWFGPNMPTTTLVAMDDGTYRGVLRAKIAANNWDGTLASFYAALRIVLPATTINVVDNQNMTVTVHLTGTLPSNLMLAVLQAGYLPLKPAGVAVTYLTT